MNNKEIQQTEKYNRRLAKSEATAQKRINAGVSKRYNLLERKLVRNYERIRNNPSILNNQKAALLQLQLNEDLNIVGDNRTAFRNLFTQADKEAKNFVRLQVGTIARISNQDNINRWVADSQNRANKWGNQFQEKANVLFDLAYSQNWSGQRLAQQLRALSGVTQQRIEGITRTASATVANQTIDGQYEKLGYNFVLYVAVGDDRTCIYCAARHMRLYKRGTISVPTHVRCRCITRVASKEDIEKNKDFLKKEYSSAITNLKARGGQPNTGLAPFEKSKGIKKSPLPVWSPSRGWSRGEKPKNKK